MGIVLAHTLTILLVSVLLVMLRIKESYPRTPVRLM